MIEKEQNGIQWLEFELLADSPLIHALFMKYGGHSEGDFASLNVSKTVGDNLEHVEKNIESLKETLHIKDLALARLYHSDIALAVSAPTPTPLMCDALITATPQLSLMTSYADCQIAIIYDPIHHVIANVHSGWRGSVANIYASTITSMQQQFGSTPADLLVAIGPSLGPQNAEFIHYKTELPESFWQFQVKPNYFDFWAISSWQLDNAGILPHHIQIAAVDTYTNHNFFSYRRDRICGRQPAICCLLEK